MEDDEGTENLAFTDVLVQESPDALIALSTAGKVLFWNRGAEGLFGHAQQEAVGLPLEDLVVPADLRDEARRSLTDAIAGTPAVYEAVRRRKDGSPINVHVAHRAVRDAQGRLLFIAASIKDVTQLKNLREERAVEALAVYREHDFDAVTLDVLLPDMSGLKVLQQQRRQEKTPNLPIILVTVVADSDGVVGFPVHDVFTKPIDGPAILASLDRAGLSADSSGSVLVVDDDPRSLRLMAATLEKLRYRAICSQDGRAALTAVESTPPLAVILDLLMPGMNGFEFLQHFRRHPRNRQVPVIIWTAKDLSHAEQAQLRDGAQSVLRKSSGGIADLIEEMKAVLPTPPPSVRGA